MKNGASEYIGGSPTRLFVLVLIWDGRVIHLVSSKFESLAVFGVATVDFGLGFTP